jgi:hypothetical protein
MRDSASCFSPPFPWVPGVTVNPNVKGPEPPPGDAPAAGTTLMSRLKRAKFMQHSALLVFPIDHSHAMGREGIESAVANILRACVPYLSCLRPT